ncbi:DUF6609 family protein [Clostridium sp. C8-1-8]|uniref:DUF6609 family protein n=1 Tax=Clostridium sp. C8-1-8 TaxID=2698831 RepID=UPI0013716C2E|nr:DUF6609 family protein [Clostridium sp. C8-1-8]
MQLNKGANIEIKYPYPRQKVCGLFLLGAGITMALASFFGTSKSPSVFIFVIGYFISNVGIMFNSKVRKKYSVGEPTALQKKASNFALIFLMIMAVAVGMTVGSKGDVRLTWLLILIIVGVHFVPFALIHGKLMYLLAVLLVVNGCIGIYLNNETFYIIGIIDALIKISIGVSLYVISPKPSCDFSVNN